ncbi:MAG: sugar ABC transporter substrate-binding protein [Chloroflexi bacterium]|nr:sugar ABC transporter substrate-binding protein [Chloroflexota bacterium]
MMRKAFFMLIVSLVGIALVTAGFPSHSVLAQGPKQEVRFLIQETDPPSVDAYLSMEQEFEAQYPQYDIVIEFTNPDSGIIKIANVLAAGGVLDVFQPNIGMAVTMAGNGQLLPVDDVVESLGGEEAFLPNTLLEYDGQTMCIPYAGGGVSLWYRTDLFEEAGLEPPTTWDEWLAAAEALTGNGIYGVALPAGENQLTSLMLQLFLWLNGTQTITKDGVPQLAGNERAAEALEFYTDLLEFAPPGATSYSFGDIIDGFTSGRVATAPYWGRVLSRIYSDAPDLMGKIGAVPMPMNRLQTTYVEGSMNCIYAETRSPEGALAWMEFMNRPEQAVKLQLTVPGHLTPMTYAQVEALQNAEGPLKENPEIANTLLGIHDYGYNVGLNLGGINEETLTVETTGIPNPYLTLLYTVNAEARAVQNVVIGGMDVAEALEQAQAEIEEAIATAN